MSKTLAILAALFYASLNGAEVKHKAVSNEEICELVRKVFPEKGWDVENRIGSIVVTGPVVQKLWRISLPLGASEEEIWRKFSQPIQIEVTIHFQRRISDEELAALREIQERFTVVRGRLRDRTSKNSMDGVKEFGFIRLPDYRFSKFSVFVDDNTSGLELRPADARKTIDRVLATLGLLMEKVEQE